MTQSVEEPAQAGAEEETEKEGNQDVAQAHGLSACSAMTAAQRDALAG